MIGNHLYTCSDNSDLPFRLILCHVFSEKAARLGIYISTCYFCPNRISFLFTFRKFHTFGQLATKTPSTPNKHYYNWQQYQRALYMSKTSIFYNKFMYYGIVHQLPWAWLITTFLYAQIIVSNINTLVENKLPAHSKPRWLIYFHKKLPLHRNPPA